MTPGIVVLLFGVFVVPAVLLWAGHRMRRRSATWHAAFWGAVTGHVIAIIVGSIAAMLPAREWSDASVVRGALGLWSFLVLPAAGATIAALARRK